MKIEELKEWTAKVKKAHVLEKPFMAQNCLDLLVTIIEEQDGRIKKLEQELLAVNRG